MSKKPARLAPADHIQCDICKENHDFELPADVLDAARNHQLVIFAGSGISTESSTVMPYTFYDEIARELGCNPKGLTTPFPELMSQYCRLPNGRRMLLKKLKGRFDYIEAFPGLLQMATRFHQTLSTIPHLDDIVTTNWDSYFERFCGATPFVSAEDFAFWDMPGRKVFKLHGSVHSYGSVVATTEDYARNEKQLTKGLIGSNLKMLLATKVVVFVGYSLRDPDFLRLYNLLKKEMGAVLPRAYAVTVSTEAAEHSSSLGLTPIVTSGTFFIEVLKKHLVAKDSMIPDDRFDSIPVAMARVHAAHFAVHDLFTYRKNPELLYCASYQDGLLDAFGRIMQRKATGEYSCPGRIPQLMLGYVAIKRDKRKEKKYEDIAYIEGYMNGLKYVLITGRGRRLLPLYFVFGHDSELRTIAQYKTACKHAKRLHRAAYARAVRQTVNLEDGTELHHTPFLL
jgi:hypothetical protein